MLRDGQSDGNGATEKNINIKYKIEKDRLIFRDEQSDNGM